jgi:HPt (histidine-containing phosphotransfer) domain-containing protein
MTGGLKETSGARRSLNVVNGSVTEARQTRVQQGAPLPLAARDSEGARRMAEISRTALGTPVIDLSHLSAQTGGDTGLQMELLDLFADQCVRQLDLIRRGGPGDACDAAHTLKGAARAIGAWAVADAAEKVEQSLARRKIAEGLGELAVAADEARAAITVIRHAA